MPEGILKNVGQQSNSDLVSIQFLGKEKIYYLRYKHHPISHLFHWWAEVIDSVIPRSPAWTYRLHPLVI